MHKLFRVVVTIVVIISYVPLEALADGELQEMADIVKNMDTTRLCDRDCKPVVRVSGTHLTVSYETQFTYGEDTDALCKCMYDYMKAAVGDAKSDCKVTSTQLAIVFNGEYDPHKTPLPSLTTLASVLSHYDKPDLGGYECTREISKMDSRIYIKLTYSGKKYRSACDGILKYLNQNKFLGGADNKCTENAAYWEAVLDLWADE